MRIVGEHGADARHDSRAARTPTLHVGACGLARDPFGFAARQGGTAVETRGEFQAQPWPAALDAREKSAVQLSRGVAHQACRDDDTACAQLRETAAGDLRVRVLARHDDAGDARRQQRVGARRRAAEMRARLECDVGGCTTRPFARGAQREDFGVRLAGALVPAFADDLFAMSDHAADARIGLRRMQTEIGEAQRARHVGMINGGKRAWNHWF